MQASDFDHRCTEPTCCVYGQPTTTSCLYHKSREDMMLAALVAEKRAREEAERERDETIAQSKRNWADCGKMHDALGPALQIVCLSEELCDAVDAEAEDVGTGKRNSLRILQEIGPLVVKVRKQAEEAFNGWPRF